MDLGELRLRDYRPRARLRVDEHLVPRASMPAIDAHAHLGRWLTDGWAVPDVGELLEVMQASNVAAIVNLDGRWGEELDANLERYDRAHPGRFATCAHLDWGLLAEPEPAERLVGSLRQSAAAGARGLKVWKELGLRVRDERGALVMPDDPRLSDVWDAAGELGLPVLIHTADPVAFFDPLDERNERLEELLEHPDWWFGDHGRFPHFARLLDAFEGLVAAHPRTTFVGAHVAGNAEDLGWVERMLDVYPNLSVDIAARIAELGRQPRAAGALLERHPGRVLFGTDEVPPTAEVYATHFRFLETQDEHFPYSGEEVPPQGRWAISGLELRGAVLEAVYEGNARRVFSALA